MVLAHASFFEIEVSGCLRALRLCVLAQMHLNPKILAEQTYRKIIGAHRSLESSSTVSLTGCLVFWEFGAALATGGSSSLKEVKLEESSLQIPKRWSVSNQSIK